MSNAGPSTSRRTLLQATAAGSLVGLAGCLGGDDDSPEDDDLPGLFDLSGDGADAFRDWLAPEAVHPEEGRSQVLFAYQDYEYAVAEGWEEMVAIRDQEAAGLGTDPEALYGETIIGRPGDNGGLGGIQLGTFDSDSIVSQFEEEGFTVTDEYEQYTVLDGEFTVGEDALLYTSQYEHFIDAKNGDGDHLEDEYDGVGIVLSLQPAGGQMTASLRHGLEDIAVTASSYMDISDGGSPARIIRTFVFTDAEEASVERAEEIAADGSYEQTLTDEKHGRVVMLEYET